MRRGSRFRATEQQATRGCAGGWHRVPGSGYVCRGEGVIVGRGPQSFSPVPREPALEDALPYLYAYATEDDVPQYWGLPDAARESAVRDVLGLLRRREAAARDRAENASAARATPEPGLAEPDGDTPEGSEAAPDETGGEHAVEAPPPPGQVTTAEDEGDVQLEETPPELPDYVRMRMQRGFYVSLDREERVDGRTWYRTVRGAYVRAAQMRQSAPTSVRGVVVGGRWSLPIAFVYRHGTRRLLRRASDGSLLDRGVAEIGTPIAVTERTRWRRNEYAVGHDGSMFRTSSLRHAEQHPRPDGVPADGRWIHVDLSEQTLVAYEGDRPVFATIVSTGAPGFETPRGLYRIQSKHVSTTMDNLAAADTAYSIEDVPWTMYFEGNYALHGAFWHSNFGRVRSHGCVNLAPTDARWIFRWSTPTLPESWHGAFATRRSPGTHVFITE
ncbi:MAG: L,D-transpeptidase [Sandaracinaceae bacterium]|nr:L,D-transpeptidase [Myxococcales bacterium]MCB9658810.1 L,D-transpeptidase [Sandaracinaceae bacterium]